ncbi:MAG: hypothetical protein PHI28_05485 [Mangrovibacterium sp.]|nr:hypothetical protein [Mangrovibacterium sp.]
MKSNKHSKKNFKYSDIEKNDIGSVIKGAKKDRSSKRRLSIYDDFEDENIDDLTFNAEVDDFDEED